MSLQIKSLSKTYEGGIKALDNVSLDIPKGVFGLLGPNGAGKTTLMNTIATLQIPDNGSIYFEDINVLQEKEKLRKILGYLPQAFGFYPSTSAEELLDYLAMLKGVTDKKQREKTVRELLEMTHLTQYSKMALGKYSGGMKQRFGIAQALIGEPQLLIVDEPTAGLDPEERIHFYNILSEVGNSITVILSTHIVNDVSATCQSFAIIKKGRLSGQSTPEKAIKEVEGKIWEKTVEKSKEVDFKEKYNVLSSHFSMGKIRFRCYSEQLPDSDFEAISPNLEDFYFTVTHDKNLMKGNAS